MHRQKTAKNPPHSTRSAAQSTDKPHPAPAGARLNGYLVVAAGIVVAGLVLHLVPLGGTRLVGAVTDSAHVLGFAALGFSLLRGLALRYEGRPDARRLRTFVLAGGLALAFGMLAEALQIPAHRDASWGDLGRDACGIAAGLLAAYAARVAGAGRILVLAAMLILPAGLFGPGRKLAGPAHDDRHTNGFGACYVIDATPRAPGSRWRTYGARPQRSARI